MNTTDGVVAWPSEFLTTIGFPYSSTHATAEYVVPKSMPTARPNPFFSLCYFNRYFSAMCCYCDFWTGISPDAITSSCQQSLQPNEAVRHLRTNRSAQRV